MKSRPFNSCFGHSVYRSMFNGFMVESEFGFVIRWVGENFRQDDVDVIEVCSFIFWGLFNFVPGLRMIL